MINADPEVSSRRAVWRSRLPRLVVLLLAATSCDDGPVEPVSIADVPPEYQEFAAMMNDRRAAAGCVGLRWHQPSADVAQRHSDDMVQRRFFGHVNPDGKTLAQRLSEAGVGYRIAGENLAAGQPTYAEVIGDWMASSGHRRNIENCSFTHHGLGLRDRHWTHVLITPR